jgi:hypothetical protein
MINSTLFERNRSDVRFLVPLICTVVLIATVALADPYGPPHAVTDMAPYCATCHASTNLAQLPDLGPEAAVLETIEEKHSKYIKNGAAYKDLTRTEAETVLKAVQWTDENATVSIHVTSVAKRNSRVEVTVTTRGGAGPVIGVSLVDSIVRFQARPIGSSGFRVLGPPLIIGPDRKTQSEWIDRRVRGTDLGLSTIMITGIKGDAVTQKVSETRTTWTLRAPAEPGTYGIAAAFYYGTEKSHPLGTVMRNGVAMPRGGASGASGRVMFSQLMKITIN